MGRMIIALIAVLLAGQALSSTAFFLPFARSGGCSVRYFADHHLEQQDSKAEYALVT